MTTPVKASVSARGRTADLGTPEAEGVIEDVARGVAGGAVGGGLWGQVVTGPVEPLAFQTTRKGLLAALARTQHAMASDEDRPILQSWWLTVDGHELTIHASDNYRLARATIDVESQGSGWLGIHRGEGKALLAFLASGPDDLAFDAGDGVWSVHHGQGQLKGLLSPGEPPDWSAITGHEPGRVVRYALNGRFASDAAKAGVGASGIVFVDYESMGRPTVWHSDGYSEWVMPVRVGVGDDPDDSGDDEP